MDDRAWLVIPIFLSLLAVLRGIGYLIGSYGLAYVSNYLVHELRLDIFEKYLQLPFGFFDRSMSGAWFRWLPTMFSRSLRLVPRR